MTMGQKFIPFPPRTSYLRTLFPSPQRWRSALRSEDPFPSLLSFSSFPFLFCAYLIPFFLDQFFPLRLSPLSSLFVFFFCFLLFFSPVPYHFNRSSGLEKRCKLPSESRRSPAVKRFQVHFELNKKSEPMLM